jgi:hypothetical protein
MGLAKETTFGTPVTATVFCPVGSIKVDPDPGLFYPELMMNTVERNVFPLYGEYKFNGSATFPLFPSNGIELLVGAIGTDVVSGTANPWTHTISPANTLPSFTVEKNVGGFQSEQYAGCRINKYELKAAVGNQAVEATVDFMGQNVATLTSPTAVTVVNESPFVFAEGTTTILGNVDATVQSVTLTIENTIKESYTGGSHTPTYLTPVARHVHGQVTLVFSSLNDATYGYFQKIPVGGGAATTGTVVLALAHAGSGGSVTITLQNVSLSKYADDLKFGDVALVTLDFEAAYNFGSSKTLGAVVLNSHSAQY